MSTFVFDADGLIKLVKAGIFPIKHKCMISEQVYAETVIEGKKNLHTDAFKIEQLVCEAAILVKKTRQAAEFPDLGKGELSTLDLCKRENASAIISDDRRFLRLLEEQKIPFIIPTEFIAALVHAKYVPRKAGIEALQKIKEFVKDENYESALSALGGKP